MHYAPIHFMRAGWAATSARFWRRTGPPSHADAIRVDLEPRSVDAMDGELFVAVLGITGHPDRANDFAARIADQHAGAVGKDLIAARGNEVAHEDRPLLRALANQFRAAAERQCGISFAVSHFEPDHRGAIFLLERFHLAAGFDHDDAQGPAIERGAARDDRVDDALGLIECEGRMRCSENGMLCWDGRGDLTFCHLPQAYSIAPHLVPISPLA